MVIYSPLDSSRQITDPKELRRDCNKAYRDLNISNLEAEGGLSLDFKKTSKWQLITEHIINTPKVIDILKIRDTNQRVINTSVNKMYETLWDIIAKFNFMPIQSGVIIHYDGKIENRDIGEKVIKDIKNYLEKEMIQTSSKQGVSDITFSKGGNQEEDTRWACQIKDIDSGSPKPTFYLTSVKYFEKPKAIDRFDIEKLFTAYRDNRFFDNKNVEICVVTRYSDEFKLTIDRSIRKYISNQVYHIFGSLDDLQRSYTLLYQFLQLFRANPIEGLTRFLTSNQPTKTPIVPKLHQDLIVRQIQDGISRGDKRFLCGAVARSGKTYIAGLLVNRLKDEIDTVLVMSPYPKETLGQFAEVFNDYSGFEDYDIISTPRYAGTNIITLDRSMKKKKIFLFSTQFLKIDGNRQNREGMSKKESEEIRGDLKIKIKNDTKRTLIIYDEAHQGGTSNLSLDLLDNESGYTRENTIIVFLTATYHKVLGSRELNVLTRNCFEWSYQNIQDAKRLDEEAIQDEFINQFGEVFQQSIDYLDTEWNITIRMIKDDYLKFPDVYFITSNLDEESLRSIKKQQKESLDKTFKMDLLLTDLDGTNEDIKFKYQREVFSLLNYLQALPKGSEEKLSHHSNISSRELKETNFRDEKRCVYERISQVCRKLGSRTRPADKGFIPNTQLWFLPIKKKNNTDPEVDNSNSLVVQYCLAKLIHQHPLLSQRYNVLLMSSSYDKKKHYYFQDINNPSSLTCLSSHNPKSCIKTYERDSYLEGKGVIVLANSMLTTGVSLPCVDIVILLDDIKSSDMNFQRMFRCLTESDGKKAGFVVDLNPRRVIHTLYQYGISKKKIKTPKVLVRDLLDIYYIDIDYLMVGGVSKKPQIDFRKIDELIKNLGGDIEEQNNNLFSHSRGILTNTLDEYRDDLIKIFRENHIFRETITKDRQPNKTKKTIHKKDTTGIKDSARTEPLGDEDEIAGEGLTEGLTEGDDKGDSEGEIESEDDIESEDEEENQKGLVTRNNTIYDNGVNFIKDFITFFVILNICLLQCETITDEEVETETKRSIINSRLTSLLESPEARDTRNSIVQMALVRNKILPRGWTEKKGKYVSPEGNTFEKIYDVRSELIDKLGDNPNRFEIEYYPNLLKGIFLEINENIRKKIEEEMLVECDTLCGLKRDDIGTFIEFINRYLSPSKSDMKENADIFTPLELINGTDSSSIEYEECSLGISIEDTSRGEDASIADTSRGEDTDIEGTSTEKDTSIADTSRGEDTDIAGTSTEKDTSIANTSIGEDSGREDTSRGEDISKGTDTSLAKPKLVSTQEKTIEMRDNLITLISEGRVEELDKITRELKWKYFIRLMKRGVYQKIIDKKDGNKDLEQLFEKWYKRLKEHRKNKSKVKKSGPYCQRQIQTKRDGSYSSSECLETLDSNSDSPMYCSYDEGEKKCRPNCYFIEPSTPRGHRQCHPVTETPYRDDIDRCSYVPGGKGMRQCRLK